MIDLSRLKNLKCNYKKLKTYGFKKDGGAYLYKTAICNGEYTLIISVKNENEIKLDVVEKDTNEPLEPFYIKDYAGAFISNINLECEKIVSDIIVKCYEKNIFKNKQTLEIIDYISKKYGDELEFLWEKFSDNAICRRKDNKKWYALFVVINKNKLKLNSNEKVEVIDLRADENEIPSLVDNKTIFGGYHMNKKHWITICLDYSVPTKTICKKIDDSYILANKK